MLKSVRNYAETYLIIIAASVISLCLNLASSAQLEILYKYNSNAVSMITFPVVIISLVPITHFMQYVTKHKIVNIFVALIIFYILWSSTVHMFDIIVKIISTALAAAAILITIPTLIAASKKNLLIIVFLSLVSLFTMHHLGTLFYYGPHAQPSPMSLFEIQHPLQLSTSSIDTLFHFAYTKSLAQYGFPSLGLHGLEKLEYYVGFQKIIAGISKIAATDPLYLYSFSITSFLLPLCLVFAAIITNIFGISVIQSFPIALSIAAIFPILDVVLPRPVVLVILNSHAVGFGLCFAVAFALGFLLLWRQFGFREVRNTALFGLLILAAIYVVGDIKVQVTLLLYFVLGAYWISSIIHKKLFHFVILTTFAGVGVLVNTFQSLGLVLNSQTTHLEGSTVGAYAETQFIDEIFYLSPFILGFVVVWWVIRVNRVSISLSLFVTSIVVILSIWLFRNQVWLNYLAYIYYCVIPFLVFFVLVIACYFLRFVESKSGEVGQATLFASPILAGIFVFVVAYIWVVDAGRQNFAQRVVRSYGQLLQQPENLRLKANSLYQVWPRLTFANSEKMAFPNLARAWSGVLSGGVDLTLISQAARMVEKNGGSPYVYWGSESPDYRWRNALYLMGRTGIPSVYSVHYGIPGYGVKDYGSEGSAYIDFPGDFCELWPNATVVLPDGSIYRDCDAADDVVGAK